MHPFSHPDLRLAFADFHPKWQQSCYISQTKVAGEKRMKHFIIIHHFGSESDAFWRL